MRGPSGAGPFSGHHQDTVPGKDSVAVSAIDKVCIMQKDIHPAYNEITATCSCGNTIQTRSTLKEDIHIEVCSSCHPFYTGKQKVSDTGGRIDRFNKRFGRRSGS